MNSFKPKGYWTKDAPTKPGQYYLADYRGNVITSQAIAIKTSIDDDEYLLFVITGTRPSRVWKEVWGSWRWSVPIEIEFPPVSI